MNAWLFSEPESVATITVKQIITDHAPILHVCHDNEDGGWQFLTGGDSETADAMLVALREIVEIDPSIMELADLPEGWQATRQYVGGPWKRTESENDGS
jgi:hypothetical protein